jgi:hypothetical protein
MATRKKAGRKKPGAGVKVLDLKRTGTSLTRLKKALKKLGRRRIRLVVRNAPFKLCTARVAS